LYPAAQSIFPAENGAFEIRRNTFFYQASADRGSYFELLSLRVAPGSSPVTVTGNDFVILSPINHYVYAEGQSEAVVYGGDEAASVNLYDDGQLEAASRQPDISFEDFEFLDDGFRRVQTPGYIAFDDTDKRIVIDGGTGPDLGSVWFDATRSIGGQSDFCDVGECLFGVGIRAFFTLDYSGTGAGLTFALLNAVDNFAGSIGGDIQASEMLAYAGDSRLVAASPSAPEDFLDNSGVGLRPPKFALEFDTRVNFDSVFEQNLNYCSDAVNLKTNTRNDPLDNDKDAVQYVFWAGESLNIPCRDGANAGGDPVPESYDDNRHDAPGRWDFPTGNDVLSSPAVAADGTIYVGSLDGRLYAVNPDGTPRWSFPAGSAIQASPAVAPDGTVLIGSTGGVFFALNPNGSQKWRYPASGSVSEILTTAAIDPDQGPGGAVYFGTGDNALPNDARLYALDLGDGSLLWEFSPTSIGVSGDDDINSSPAIDPVTGRVIFGSDLDIVYALDPDARQSALPFPQDGEWTFNRNRTEDMDDIESRPAIDTSRNSVYVETEGFKLFALNLSNGSKRWEFELSTLRLNTTELKSSPAIGADGTVYVGSRADKLYALNPADRNAREPFPTANEWAFQTGGDVFSSPAVGDDGKIYFGSNDGFVYVAYPQGTESFKFETNGAVRSGPFVKPDGTFYVGSNDSNLYAFQPLNLGNFRQNDLPGNRYLVTYDEPGAAATPYLVSSPTDSDDWLNSGPWAIRLEVKRALIGGVGRYTFSAWIRQCEFGDCRDVVGTFFSDTRVEYDPVGKPPLLQQVIELDATANDRWDRFLFGFTAQTGADESQSASIADFALSFIRPNDPVIVADPDFP
jgi:outer membrane protein assembly factor BamB